MLKHPADVGWCFFWIYFHNLGDCYPLLEAEIFGMVMCVTASSVCSPPEASRVAEVKERVTLICATWYDC